MQVDDIVKLINDQPIYNFGATPYVVISNGTTGIIRQIDELVHVSFDGIGIVMIEKDNLTVVESKNPDVTFKKGDKVILMEQYETIGTVGNGIPVYAGAVGQVLADNPNFSVTASKVYPKIPVVFDGFGLAAIDQKDLRHLAIKCLTITDCTQCYHNSVIANNSEQKLRAVCSLAGKEIPCSEVGIFSIAKSGIPDFCPLEDNE